MGIFHAENLLDIDRSSVATYPLGMAAKGLSAIPDSGTHMRLSVTKGLLPVALDPEQRQWAQHVIRSAGTGLTNTAITGIPVPSGPFYLTFRFYFGTNTATGSMFPFILHTAASPTANVVASIDSVSKNLRLGGSSPTNGTIASSFDASKINTLEFYFAGDGTYKVWLNDVPQPVTFNVLQPTGFIYMTAYRSGTISTVTGVYGDFPVYLNDIIVVDPSTPGLQYRAGQSARVESMDFTADQIAQWALPAGVTGSHYPIMNLPYKTTYPDAEKLTSMTIGAEELYAAAALRTDLGSLVYAVELESSVANTAGSAHVLTLEGDFGTAGKKALADLTVPIGGVAQYNRLVLNKNPNGNVDWTLAAATAPKVGYIIKS